VPWEILGWPEEVYRKASPETKLAAIRTLQAEAGEAPTHGREARRPQEPKRTEARQRELDGLVRPQDRLTAYRRGQGEDAAGQG
jgi:hypothetical protein